jgi:hypothetical protein
MSQLNRGLKSVLMIASITVFCLWHLTLAGAGQSSTSGPLKADGEFSVTVDYGQSFLGMISAGKYDTVAKEVTSDHFPVKGQRKVNVRLVVLSAAHGELSIDGVLAGFDRLGYRAATFEELLTLGAQHPELQRKFNIVEFGTLWRNDASGVRVAAYLRGTERGVRALDIYFVDSPSGSGSVPWVSKYPPAKPGALVCEPLKAAAGSLTRPRKTTGNRDVLTCRGALLNLPGHFPCYTLWEFAMFLETPM